MALTPHTEAKLKKLERLGAEVSGKIDEAAEVLKRLLDDEGFDPDDPSVVRNAEELANASRTVTPPNGSEPSRP